MEGLYTPWNFSLNFGIHPLHSSTSTLQILVIIDRFQSSNQTVTVLLMEGMFYVHNIEEISLES